MINGLITIGLFLVVQLIAAIAWASAMNTKMSFMLEFAKEFVKAKDTYSTKAEVATALVVVEKNTSMALTIAQKEVAIALAASEKELKAMWSRIDTLSNKA